MWTWWSIGQKIFYLIFLSRYISLDVTCYIIFWELTWITISQVHMTNFRTKLAIILVGSKMNDDDVRNHNLEFEEINIDPTDCTIVDCPLKKSKTSTSSFEDGLLSQSLVISPSVNPTNTDLIESSEVEALSQSSVLLMTNFGLQKYSTKISSNGKIMWTKVVHIVETSNFGFHIILIRGHMWSLEPKYYRKLDLRTSADMHQPMSGRMRRGNRLGVCSLGKHFLTSEQK